MKRFACRAGLALTLLLYVSPLAEARQANWREIKCQRYRAAWDQALHRIGHEGLTPAFLDAHQTFLNSRCEAETKVCPRTKAELALANIMVIRAMNAGTASTFLPFGCRR